jgi:restriction system protein
LRYEFRKKTKGPEFLKYVIPVLSILQSNGGAGNSSDVIEKVIFNLGITDEEMEITTSNGQSKIRNQIQWARFYLFKAGLIDNSQRGIWRLTHEGLDVKLDSDSVYELFKKVHENEKQSKVPKNTKNIELEFEEKLTEEEEHTVGLLNLIHSLSPAGFEKLCKRLLTEIGINEITITGGSGDQGIDGKGIVKLNDVVSLKNCLKINRFARNRNRIALFFFTRPLPWRGDKYENEKGQYIVDRIIKIRNENPNAYGL